MLYQTINIQLSQHSYPVYVGQSLLSDRTLFERHIRGKQVMIVTQKNIADFYLSTLLSTLDAYHCDVTYLPRGERYKNMVSWRKILDNLVENHHERSTTIIALGGGLVGDLAGFAAACYLRGVNYIQIPTTLIAQVDSAIGGKTGFNHAAGKNLIGSFYHPCCVIADLLILQTLPQRELIAGLAEVIKYGLIHDESFFSWLENNMSFLIERKQEAFLHAITTSAGIKGHIIAQDNRELSGLRCLLNFGHTLGHAIEGLFKYRIFLHGEAVAIGMNVASWLSMEKGWLLYKDYARILQLLSASHLPLYINRNLDEEKLFSYLMRDKKRQDQRSKWVLLKGIGQALLTDQIVLEDVRKAIYATKPPSPRRFLPGRGG